VLEACKGCGRWDGVTTYCMQPYSLPSHTSAPLDVLVVSEYPSQDDDARGVPFLDEPHKDLIALPMSKTPWHVQFTHLARCAGSKPTSAQLGACKEEFFLPMLNNSRPKVIWAIGAQVAKHLLQSSLSLDKLRSMGVSKYQDIPLVILEHPSMHSRWKLAKDGGKDLRPGYKAKFELTQRILTGKFQEEAFEFETITDPNRALELGEFLRNDCYPGIGLDTEVGLQPNTNFAEQSERVSYLTTGVGALSRLDNKYYAYSIDHENWTRSQVYKMLYAINLGKMPIATQAFFDFGLIWWQGDFNIFKHISAYQDIHLLGWAQNQTQAKNGLEEQLINYLGWSSYKGEMDEWGARLEKSFVPEDASPIQFVDYRHRKWDNPFDFNKYQAKDGLGTVKLWYERYQTEDPEALVPSEKFNINGYRLSLAYIRSLSYISRHGIPINLDKLAQYRQASQAVVDQYQSWLEKHPFTDKVLGGVINTKSADQMHKLFEAFKLEARSRTEKTNKHQVNQDELLRQSNSHFHAETGKLIRYPRSAVSREKAAIQDYLYSVLQVRMNRDKQSKTQGLVDFALPGHTKEILSRGLTPDGTPLHWLHPFYKVGRMDGGERGGGGIVTGRVSSVWPSMGNQAQDPELREANEAPSGWVYCEWDQSAIEPRVFAYLAGEERWKKVFELAADPATAKDPAADIYRLGWTDYQHTLGRPDYTPSMVDKETERPLAKVLILRLCYDSSPTGITRTDGMPLELTTGFAEGFWSTNKKLQAFAYATRKEVIERGGWVTTCQGRRAQYPLYNTYRLDDDLHWDLPLWKLQRELRISESDAEKLRAAMNSIIQGGAADITLTALEDLVNHLHAEKITWLIPTETVHDNIGALVRETHIQEADKLVNDIMTDPLRLLRWGINIPFPSTGHRIMKTGFKMGASKGTLKEIR